MKKRLVISNSGELVRVQPDKVVYISSDGNYCHMFQADNESRLLSFQLGELVRMTISQLGPDNPFIKVGRGLIINRNYAYYINIGKQQLILSDADKFSYRVSASKEALKDLKNELEEELEKKTTW